MARSIEIACFWAYKSHQELAKNYDDALQFMHIRQDKFDHIVMLESALKRFHYGSNIFSDLFFELIGKIAYFTIKNINKKIGRNIVNRLELKCEKCYAESAIIAQNIGLPYTAQLLYYMGVEQKRHEIISNKVIAWGA